MNVSGADADIQASRSQAETLRRRGQGQGGQGLPSQHPATRTSRARPVMTLPRLEQPVLGYARPGFPSCARPSPAISRNTAFLSGRTRSSSRRAARGHPLHLSVIATFGDEVIIPSPTTRTTTAYARSRGLRMRPCAQRRGRFPSAAVEAIESKITPGPRPFSSAPQQPTGTSTRPGARARRGLVKKHDLFLIGDEVYKEFIYDGLKHKSVLEYEDVKERVVVVDSISKRYSCCGGVDVLWRCDHADVRAPQQL